MEHKPNLENFVADDPEDWLNSCGSISWVGLFCDLIRSLTHSNYYLHWAFVDLVLVLIWVQCESQEKC